MNKNLKPLIFRSIGLAMGVAAFVLNLIKTLELKTAITLLSISLICLAISEFEDKK